MRCFLTGGTGFIGRALTARLVARGDAVTLGVRSAARARAAVGEAPSLVDAAAGDDGLAAALSRCDAVINLAGETIASRWTTRRKVALVESRVGLTRRLVAAMARAAPRPGALVSASAVGWYGDRGDERLTEESAPGPAGDFLADLCARWEEAALEARAFGARVVRARIGVVLGRGGGALGAMLAPFSLGLGGRLGDGRQHMSWVHLDDLTAMVAQAAADARWEGAVNMVAPAPATNREFTAALGRALRRPTLLPLPRAALRLLFGEMSAALLASQRVEPRRAAGLGFAFRFPDLDGALRDLLARQG